MQNMGGEKCPFTFNFDASTFKVGDIVSYRVPEEFDEMPFMGRITAVFEDYIEISADDPAEPDRRMKATRESRPVVTAKEALG
jgi:hypothetical protein